MMKKVILLCLLVFFLLVVIILPIAFCHFVFTTTDKMVVEELDNWIINNQYPEWKTVQLPKSTMKIPKSWELKSTGNTITIYENERIVANGIVLDETKENYTSMLSAFNDACFGFPIISKEYNHLTVTNLGTGAFYWLVTCTGPDGTKKEHYQMSLSYDFPSSIVFDFGDNESIDTGMVLEQIEAMAYSFSIYTDRGRLFTSKKG